jgi:hypothetical protein
MGGGAVKPWKETREVVVFKTASMGATTGTVYDIKVKCEYCEQTGRDRRGLCVECGAPIPYMVLGGRS